MTLRCTGGCGRARDGGARLQAGERHRGLQEEEGAAPGRIYAETIHISFKNPPTLGVLICPLWSLSSLCVPPLSRCLRCAFHRCPRCLLAQVPRCAKEPEKGILCRGPNLPRPPPNLLHTAYVSCTVAWEWDTCGNFRWGNTPALVLSVGRSNVLVVPPPLKRVGDGRKPYNKP